MDVEKVFSVFDFGSGVAEKLIGFKSLKGVYGNIDGYDIRSE